MEQPQQPSSVSNAAVSGLPIEVTVVSDADTTRRLSRVLALARLRSPYTWGFILLIPLILMSRRFIEVFIAANSPGWSVSNLFVSYFGLLAVTIVMGLLLTGIQMIKRNPSIAAYTAPGTPVSARFHQDSLELLLATGTTSIPYGKIKDLFGIGGGVFLREQGTRGLALPRELFPDKALDVMGRQLPGHVADGLSGPLVEPARAPTAAQSHPPAKRDRKLMLVAAAGGLVVVAVIAVVAVSQRSSDSAVDTQSRQQISPASSAPFVPLPNPCALPSDQMQRFGFIRQVLNEDAQTQRRCEWYTNHNSDDRQYDSARVFLRTKRMADQSSPRPVRIGDAIDGQEFVEVDDPGTNHYVMCYVVWPTSYGFVRLELHGYSIKGVDSGQLCRDAEELANVLSKGLSN
ncbi:hypothetical protein [Nocardia sp. NPDC004860]|uniref:hypothetical protein n=1 Tax=Nocardia sp. NPDC004860 TaxID=3154557 RepID=UPI0033A45A44